MQTILGQKTQSGEVADLEARRWYRMAGGYGHDVLIATIKPAGSLIRAGFTGRTVPQWSAISEDGFRYEISSLDVGRPGIGGLRGPVDDLLPLTDDDIRALDGKREQGLTEAKRKRNEQEAKDAADRESLPARYPHLVPVNQTPKTSHHAAGAKNLRRELEKAFPGIKFSVHTKSYSGGCSMTVNWEYGPPESAVREIAHKYQTRSFNSMEDLEEIVDNNFADVFGGAGYVFENRHIPHDMKAEGEGWFDASLYGDISRELCRLQGIKYEANQWQRGLCGEGDTRDLLQHCNRLLAETTFPAGFSRAQFHGVECKPWVDGKGYDGEQPWRIVISEDCDSLTSSDSPQTCGNSGRGV